MAKVQQGEGVQGQAACEALVKRRDKDRYYLYAALRAPSARDLLPLFAFNSEIAKTRDVVSEPTLGLIRLQWWREAVEGACKGTSAPPHEVMTPLAEIIRRHNLSFSCFDELLTARERDFDPAPFVTRREYLEHIVGLNLPLNKLALQVLGQDGQDDEDTLRALSRAYGVVAALRALPAVAFTDKSQLPLEVLRAYNVPEYIEKEQDQAGLFEPVTHNFCKIIKGDLVHMPGSSFLKCLKELNRGYLEKILRFDRHVYDPRAHTVPTGMLLRAFFWGY